MTDLLIAVGATAYLSYVIVNTAGIAGSFAWLRARDPIHVTHCIFCISFWLALACLGVLRFGEPFAVRWLIEAAAVAGVALMATAWTGVKHL